MPSINGFDVVPYGSPKLKTYVVPGTTTKLSVRAEVAPLLIGFAADFNTHVEKLDGKSSWGHAPRKIAGSDSWSFHAPGIAIDLNANAHPMGKRGTFSTSEVAAIRALLTKYRFQGQSIFRWGGDYKSKADDMHFEIIVARATALAAVTALQTPTTPKPPSGGSWTEALMADLPIIQKGSTDVFYNKLIQGALHAHGHPVKIDGDFGDITKGAVMMVQRKYGAEDIDGAVGRETWPILLLRKDTR